MTKTRTMLRGLGAAAAALALGAGPAAAADGTASIAHVESGPGELKILVSVPADAEVDLEGVEVSLNETDVTATAEPAETEDTVRRTTVLVIDTSKSMKGATFKAAKVAATTYINTVPDDVYVGIASFDTGVETVLTPSLDRAATQKVIDGLKVVKKSGTLLYDGVIRGVEVGGTEGQRNLLVLSDGADTSETPIIDATTAITASEALVDIVALEQSGPRADLTALEQLAEAGDGEVISSDPAALEAAFAAEAQVLAHQVLVTADVPSDFKESEATVTVTLPSSAGKLTAETFAPVEAGAPPLTRDTSWTPPSWALYAGPAALLFGIVLALIVLFARGDKTMSAEDRVSKYTAAQAQASTSGPMLDTDVTFASAKETAASVLRRNKDLDARISHRLEAAGSELKSSEWLLLHGLIFFIAGLVGIALGRNLFIGGLFLVAGLFGPWMYLGFRRSRRRKAFNSGLPDTLQLMSGSLSAGLSLAQSVDTIVREGSEPIAGEFRRVLVETRLGVSLEDALEGVAERFDSKDFEWVVMAIKIQRQVGGNLAELLDTVAATMREREYVRRQVAALAAEGKLSAWVLGLLPPLFMLYLLLTNYDYVIVMFQEPLGWLMLGGAATILAIGVFWMSRLVKVEV